MKMKRLLAGIVALILSISVLGTDIVYASVPSQASTENENQELLVETTVDSDSTEIDVFESTEAVSVEIESSTTVEETEMDTTQDEPSLVEELEDATLEESSDELLVEETVDELDEVTGRYVSTLNTVAVGKNLYVVGSDGVKYDNVAYLNVNTLISLPDDAREAYMVAVNGIAEDINAGVEFRSVTIATDSEGGLSVYYDVPLSTFSETSPFIPENIEELLSTEADDSVDSSLTLETYESTETEIETDSEENNENATEESTEVTNDPIAETIEQSQEEYILYKSPDVIVENAHMLDSYELSDEACDIEGVVDIDSLFDVYNINYFYNQLTSTEKSIFNSAKGAMVSGGRNYVSWSGSHTSTITISTALSALITTYSSKFGWMDKSANGGYVYGWRYYRGVYTYNLTLKKSRYHSSNLQSSASKKVKQLVDEAYNYAQTSYPTAPTYGIVKYLDNWLCANNYYNNNGTLNSNSIRNSAEYYYCHSPYGCLLKGYGVCESYALSLSWMLDTAGITNIYCVSDDHAYVYVLMHDNAWYMVDATWNDGTNGANTKSSGAYFLSGKDNNVSHKSTGQMFGSSRSFKYPALSASKYAYKAEPLALSDTSTVFLQPGKATTFKLNAACTKYYKHYRKTWSSSNTAVAKVNSAGRVTAVAPGSATITCKIAGKAVSRTVVVYKFDKIAYSDGKTSKTLDYVNADTVLDGNDVQSISLSVLQKGTKVYTAKGLASALNLKDPVITNSNKNVVEVSNISFSGDTIAFKVKALKLGNAKITIKFAGKTAVLTYRVKQSIEPYSSTWFDYSRITNKEYAAKAYKPAVPKAKDANRKVIAPKNLSYKVTYADNKNAGVASVNITGTGVYGGTITKKFTISPLNISDVKRISCTASKRYNGVGQKAAVTVKKNGITLRNGVDYDVLYNGSTALPKNVGDYVVTIKGKGNCSGTLTPDPVKKFTIKPIKIKDTTVVCSSQGKFTGAAVYPAKCMVKIGNNVLTPNADYKLSCEMYNPTTKTWVPVSAPNAIGKYRFVFTAYGNNVIANSPTNNFVRKAFSVVK